MSKNTSRRARALSIAVIALAAAVSAGSLAWQGLYRDQSAWIRAVWFGNDLVTLMVAIPVLAIALWLTSAGSRRGELLWYGGLGYMLYNYAYYLFGARINALFPAYVLLWVVSAIALMMALFAIDAEEVAADFAPSWRERVSAGYMGLTGFGLAIAWVAQWAGIVFAGARPSLGEAGFQLVAAMDLSFMVPFFVIGSVLLWRRRPWGFVVSPVIMTQGALYTLVLGTNSIVVGLRGLPGGDEAPIWIAWTLAGALALALLLLGCSAGGSPHPHARRMG